MRPLVPSLATLVADGRRGGLSLLEVIVAVGLSATLVVVAVQAARAAARAVRGMSAVAAENEALRSGWFIAMSDLDYWRSHADPEFPWAKGFTSETVSINGSTNHAYDKRPFRRVAWPAAEDPALLHPHDPRSWYRGSVTTGVSPMMRVPPGASGTQWRVGILWPTGTDPCTYVGTWNNDVNGEDKHLRAMPAGWTPWHLVGDYAQLADVTRPATTQAAEWRTFRELGHYGTTGYLPSGTPNLVNRPATNRDAAGADPTLIGRADRWYDWGEMPWSLGPAPFATASPFPGVSDADYTRGNYVIGAPASSSFSFHSGVTGYYVYGDSAAPNRMQNGAMQYIHADAPDPIESGPAWRVLLTDLDEATSVARFKTLNRSFPLAQYLGVRGLPLPASSSWDMDTLITRHQLDPHRVSIDLNAYREVYGFAYGDLGTYGTNWEDGRGARTDLVQRKRYAVATWHAPQTASDQEPDLATWPADAPTLSTAIYRLRTFSADRARMAIEVRTAGQGAVLQVPITALGTTYRGARLHWGWKTSVDRPSLKPMGDIRGP